VISLLAVVSFAITLRPSCSLSLRMSTVNLILTLAQPSSAPHLMRSSLLLALDSALAFTLT
jgi:hypothetical protein